MALEVVRQDIRIGLRVLVKERAFCALAVFVLAIGIAAVTTQFSVVNAVLLRPLPYADADRLVTTRGSLADLRDLQQSNGAFDGMALCRLVVSRPA